MSTGSPLYDVPRPHPLETSHSHTPPVSHTSTVNSQDDILELLAEDDEEDEILAALSSSPKGQSTSTPPSADVENAGEEDPYDNAFNAKLKQLKESLKNDIDSQDGVGNGNMDDGGPEYQNVGHGAVRTSVDPSTGVPSTERANIYENLQEFDLETNKCYSLLTHENGAPLIAESTSEQVEERETSLYENLDEIQSYLQDQEHKDKLSHTYEQLDQVFETHSSQKTDKESTDGGRFSRPRPHPHLTPKEHLEMEELVIFRSLPTLICRSNLGDESAMMKLADTANAVLKEVVKMIHSTMSKCVSYV